MTKREECKICCETTRVFQECSSCNYITCRKCARHVVEEYVHSSVGECNNCLKCNKTWSTEEKKNLLGQTFLNSTYRQLYRKRLLRRQTLLFDGTAPKVQKELKIRSLKRKVNKIHTLLKERRSLELMNEQRRLMRELLALRRSSQNEEQLVVSRCSSEDCRGILVNNGICSLCKRQTCTECMCPKEEEHQCDPDLCANITLIKNESRPCVNCSMPTMRTEGCPVMWCACCHMFWHWDTRTMIETRNFIPHNPDHRQWLRQRGGAGFELAREIGDIPCGGLPSEQEIHLAILQDWRTRAQISPYSEFIIRAVDEIRLTQRMRQRYPSTWNETEITEASRISFLIGDISESRFALTVERLIRTSEYKKDVGEVFTMFVFAAADVIQRFCSSESTSSCLEVAASLEALRILVNNALLLLKEKHNKNVRLLQPNWSWSVEGRRRFVRVED